MAQPIHDYSPRPYPSPQPAYSSSPYPPMKRPRLSPNPQSPYSSPNTSNGTLPNQVFSSPYHSLQQNGASPYLGYEQQTPPSMSGTMGPPSRPVDKPTDISELADVLAGSGVDLKAEEAGLLSRFSGASQQQNGYFSSPNPGTSFITSGLNGATEDSYFASRGVDVLSRNIPGDRSSFYGAGTFNQSAVRDEIGDGRAEEAHRRAVRTFSEQRQHHLNYPFLKTGVVDKRLDFHGIQAKSEIPRHNLFYPSSQRSHPIQLKLIGPSENTFLKVENGQAILYPDAPLTDIFTLISLAAQERLHTLVEDSSTLARGRRVGSHGIVPPELANVAVGIGPTETVTALSTPGQSGVSPLTNPLKRSFSHSENPPLPELGHSEAGSQTIAFSNDLTQTIGKVSRTDRTAEEERRAKREKRASNDMLSNEGSRANSISLDTSGTASSLLGERGLDIDIKKGVSKKEQRRQADAKATEAQQHANANKTANMSLGLGGSLGKALSWMNSNKSADHTGFPVPSRMNTSSQGQSKKTANGVGSKNTGNKASGKAFGDFREDKESGGGIQLRDVAGVLELDTKERKTLAKAYGKLTSRPRSTL